MMEVNKPTQFILDRIKPYWRKHDAIAWDSASYSTGWSAWRRGLIYEGVIQITDKKMQPLERVAWMHREASKIMKELFPDGNVNVFLEMGVARSIGGGLLLGAIRGAIIGACANCQSFQEIANGTWKATLNVRARDGESQKKEAHETLCLWHGYEIDKTWCELKKEFTYDRSDALALLTHAITKLDYTEEE